MGDRHLRFLCLFQPLKYLNFTAKNSSHLEPFQQLLDTHLKMCISIKNCKSRNDCVSANFSTHFLFAIQLSSCQSNQKRVALSRSLQKGTNIRWCLHATRVTAIAFFASKLLWQDWGRKGLGCHVGRLPYLNWNLIPSDGGFLFVQIAIFCQAAFDWKWRAIGIKGVTKRCATPDLMQKNDNDESRKLPFLCCFSKGHLRRQNCKLTFFS